MADLQPEPVALNLLARSAEEVFAAWNEPGPVPTHHHKAKRKLRSEWPALAGALDQLTAVITNDPEPRP